MKKLVLFIFLVAIGLFLWLSGLVLLLLALIQIELSKLLLFWGMGIFNWFIGNFLLIYIYYHPTKESVYKEREIEQEKKQMDFLVTGTYVIALFSLSFLLYICLKIGIKSVPDLEFFLYIVTAAAMGSFWGAGLHEMNAFLTWSKYGKKFFSEFDWSRKGSRLDWYSRTSFLKNLQIMKKRFIMANIAFVILGFIILPIINYIF